MLFPMKVQDFCYINKFKRLQKKKKKGLNLEVENCVCVSFSSQDPLSSFS